MDYLRWVQPNEILKQTFSSRSQKDALQEPEETKKRMVE